MVGWGGGKVLSLTVCLRGLEDLLASKRKQRELAEAVRLQREMRQAQQKREGEALPHAIPAKRNPDGSIMFRPRELQGGDTRFRKRHSNRQKHRW